MNVQRVIARIQKALSPDLLSKDYRARAQKHPLAGHCYTASEVLFVVLGGKRKGLMAQVARDPAGGTHWWLKDKSGRILDPTHEQFTAFGKTPPYAAGRGVGFLTKKPSRRARIVMQRAGFAC
jgi:hypothetical protein